jgi:hypothetical protein
VDRVSTLEEQFLAGARNSRFHIEDSTFHLWNLTFGICHPEGHAFVAEGLRLDRHCTTNNPGQGGRRKPADALIGKASLNLRFQK